MPFFSVVIPLFNKENHIKKTLTDVLNQSFSDFEVIIVNDGSTDNSVKVVEGFSDERIRIFHQENQGPSIARNFGIAQSKSEYIALLDADDSWHPNHLEEFYKSIQEFPEGSLFCNAYQLKLHENFTQDGIYNLTNHQNIQVVEDYFSASTFHPLAMTSGIAFRKKDFIEIGHFNPAIASGQDIDLWIRFALYKTIVFNPKITACYDKTVPQSLSKKHMRKVKHDFLNNYKEAELQNPSFKKYLDVNRYAVAIHCKYYNDYKVLHLLKKEISSSSLTYKQNILLNTPSFLVRWLKKLHGFFIKKGIQVTAFK